MLRQKKSQHHPPFPAQLQIESYAKKVGMIVGRQWVGGCVSKREVEQHKCVIVIKTTLKQNVINRVTTIRLRWCRVMRHCYYYYHYYYHCYYLFRDRRVPLLPRPRGDRTISCTPRFSQLLQS